MDPRSCLAADAAAIAAAVAADPERAVPTCPGWTMADLGTHVAGAFAFAVASLLAADGVRPERPTVHGSLTEELDRLLATLDDVDPEAMRPTFLGPRPASWWLRRMHHEAAVHRVDAYPGVDPTWIPPECARDGVAEYLEILDPTPVQQFLRLWGRPI